MGTLVGHVAPGFGFLMIGLWHLFNHIKLHALNPKSYNGPPWFPTTKFRYLELVLIMAGTAVSIAMELFIGPDRHQPLDPDGTIPSNHLHNFEHSSISMTFFTYAAFAIILDRAQTQAQHGLTQFLGAIAFAQQLLLFHLHSADHMGPEGQYHLLLQLLVFVSLSTTLIGIALPRSFLVNLLRSLSIFFQGLWLMVMGFMLWTPSLIPKGCFMNDEEGHMVVRCSSEEALHRAISLVNIQFSWFIIAVTIFAVSFYLVLVKLYSENVQYFTLGNEDEESNDDVESQKSGTFGNIKSFIHVGKVFSQNEMER
ncbi:transmembrane protein 45B-like [Abrus precatorius]|uniref:Transmembrane protein 45B-like n=1 Tax=Abrus precatorius TaxID=3816 RepID=A0A8B8JMA5_ABRPR|nr:transmembrane protein 45B-like [Abrus precatorius]